MSKRRLFLDVDNTLIASSQAYCDVYNEVYQEHPLFVKADHSKLTKWDFEDICPLHKEVNAVFESDMFWNKVQLFDKDTQYVLDKLCWKYEVWACSIGTITNLNKKMKWLQDNTPIKEYVMISNDGIKMCKDVVNMSGGIFVDDVESNLLSSNADFKICFGKVYDWNKEWEGWRTSSWKKLDGVLI
jgi:hypothetical protein